MRQKKIIFWFVLVLMYAVLFAVLYYLDIYFHPHGTRQAHLTDTFLRLATAIFINASTAFVVRMLGDVKRL